MLAHVPSFGRNPSVSPDFLAYPVPKACMHVLGTGVPGCLGVARSASSPKAAQALGCSLTAGLRISFGRVTCMARAASVPGLWTLGFLLLCGACVLVWVVVGVGFRLRPATPGWGVEVCVRLCVRSACNLPLLAGVCGVGVCGWVPVLAAPRHSWLGCRGLCLLVCALRLHPAYPGWAVRRGCVCFGSGFGCAPPLLAGVLACVCACVRAPPVAPPLLAGACGVGVCAWARVSVAPRHSWLGCWGAFVFVGAVYLYLATPGWGVRWGCVCLGSGFGCTSPLLAGLSWCVCAGVGTPLAPRHSWLGLRAVGVCVWALVSAAPRHSWLGCWAVCVLVWALRLHPATPGWDARRVCVCFGSGFGCTPPLLAGVLGCVCAGVGAPLAPRHSWLGCAPWVCVFALGFRLRPATPGWGVGVCVCSCACPSCTPLLLAGVCGVGVCVWARVSAAPRHSWLGCWVVCVLVCVLLLHPASPGWGVRLGCVCLGSGLGCALPLLAGLFGCACARVRPPLAPSRSWLGCAVWVCVFGLGFRLRPATSGWGVGLWVCSCVRSARTPPLLAGVRGVGVCV